MAKKFTIHLQMTASLENTHAKPFFLSLGAAQKSCRSKLATYLSSLIMFHSTKSNNLFGSGYAGLGKRKAKDYFATDYTDLKKDFLTRIYTDKDGWKKR